ncbi:MAG: hypothetical protein P4M11_04350 [Candidatus Pacebacteria bacterium]|nr:hypothetical protein [Candidatus Paceibacterota bacterium]
MIDIGRQQELYIRGYIGEHSRVCPCPNECPLGLAMRTNKSSLLKIDKSQHAFKSLPLLVAHAERLYEYYIEKY